MRFRDKVALVTGAAGGLGSEIARAFVADGAHVIVADIHEDAGAALAAELRGRSEFLKLDVTDESDWLNAIQFAQNLVGGLDILINNAGFFQPNVSFEDMPLDLWRKHFAVNSESVFLGCKHAIRSMKHKKAGSIVNVGSGMAIMPDGLASAYCSSKAAMLMTTRTAALSAGAYGIRVNAVLPGPVNTPMLMGNLVEGQSEDDYLRMLEGFSPLGALATPGDIARAVLFLADPQNTAVTGVYLRVDGGNLPTA